MLEAPDSILSTTKGKKRKEKGREGGVAIHRMGEIFANDIF
jgi:hypothetical protein